MPARQALNVIDDRPIQILVVKPGEDPTGGAVPVQRMPTGLEPLQTPILRATASRRVHDCNWIQRSHSDSNLRRRQSTACSIQGWCSPNDDRGYLIILAGSLLGLGVPVIHTPSSS